MRIAMSPRWRPVLRAALFGLVLVPAAADRIEAEVTLDLLDNGGFEQSGPEVPWWQVVRGEPRVEPPGWEDSGSPVLTLPAGASVRQPLACLDIAADRFLIEGEVFGVGKVLVLHGAHRELVEARVGVEGEWQRFRLVGMSRDLAAIGDDEGSASVATFAAQETAQPRLVLELTADSADCAWRGLTSAFPFPDPGEGPLRAEVFRALEEVFDPYLGRALDDIGSVNTAFVAFDFDADTGERGDVAQRTGLHPLYTQLLDAWQAAVTYDVRLAEKWRIPLERYLENLLDVGLHPDTGLPRSWDPSADEPVDDVYVEIGLVFRYLIDVAERGPETWRERARAAAVGVAEAVLRYGLLPDGQIAAAYRPSDGDVGTAIVPLRRLDVAAPLTRMGRMLSDERMLRAAREAVLTLEFDHHWPSSQNKIDPGFDDDFGHYGARAMSMWSAQPDDPVFRRLAVSGYDTYVPALWRILRGGGYIAADQTRCWEIFVDIAAMEPERFADVRALLRAAARSHFKGQQGNHGAWLDVTMQNYDPVANLPVGDIGGLPQNLFSGLAFLGDKRVGLSADERAEVRAMFWSLLHSTREEYGGKFGWIDGARRREGENAFNSAAGSLRLAGGLIEWLHRAP